MTKLLLVPLTALIISFAPLATFGQSNSTATDSIAKTDSIVKRDSFFRRFYKYFEGSNEDKTLVKKIDFSIIGGPHYSSDIGVGIGLVAAGLYRIDKTDLSIPPSNISIFGDIASSGFYMLGIRGNTLIKSAKYRVDYSTYFFSFPSAFYGIGYKDGLNNTPTSYTRQQTNLKIDFLHRIAKNTYVGVGTNFSYVAGQKFKDISYLTKYGADTKYTNLGVGFSIMYDSRDFIPNASKGWYARLDERFYPNGMVNKGGFSTTEIFLNYYHKVWKGGILAYDFHTLLNTGDVPWTMMAKMGGSYRMRGYYEGRYRDKGMMEIQGELRQKVYGRSGFTAWVGAGNVFPTLSKFNIKHTLPNYGIGYRWEFKNRVNVRLDYGFGRNQSGFIFNINEAF